jgi:hypothetical protein
MVKVNQQLVMHQLAFLSIGWVTFFHSVLDGVHHSPFLLSRNHCLILNYFFHRPNLTHSYLINLPTFISIIPTLVPY